MSEIEILEIVLDKVKNIERNIDSMQDKIYSIKSKLESIENKVYSIDSKNESIENKSYSILNKLESFEDRHTTQFNNINTTLNLLHDALYSTSQIENETLKQISTIKETVASANVCVTK